MKKFLFTLAALLMAGSVCADEYLFMDDFQVPDSIMQQTSNKKRSMVVPIHAQFDRYVSSWQMWLQCPEGVTVYAVTTGEDYPLTYTDAVDNEVTFTPGFSWNDENQTGIAAVLLEQGYYYPEGTDPEEDDPVCYGNPKWLGAYDNYLMVTLRFAADFTGGELMVITEPASTDDPRGEICPKNQHFEKPCMITVEGAGEPEKTEAPTYTVVDDPEAQTVTVIATGAGHITILNDEMLVAEGDGEAVWVIPYGDDPEGEEFGFTVYAQEEGKEMSDPVNGEVYVPGKTGEEPIDPHMVGKWIVLIEQDGTERWVQMNQDPSGEDNWSVMMTLHHWPWNEEVPFYFMVDGVRYGSETDMQLPAMGSADETVLNPVFAGDNMFYVPSTYTYTFGLQFKDGVIYLLVAQGPQTAINEMNAGKNIAGVRYFNMAGQEMQEANGMTIVVTTYTDGTTSAVKVMK